MAWSEAPLVYLERQFSPNGPATARAWATCSLIFVQMASIFFPKCFVMAQAGE
ncbi:unnamed protein product [Rhodiola kirilowii]